MKKIRNNCFETNSSSTHAIVIPKVVDEDEYSLYDSLDHNYSFGREESRLVDSWDEKLAYTYMLLKDNFEWSSQKDGYKPKHITTTEEIETFKGNVISLWYSLDSKNIQPTPQDIFDYIDRGGNDGNLTGNDSFVVLTERWGNYVDHGNGLDDTDFLDRIKNDLDFLERFIFNKQSYITVGGDEYRGYNIKTIGFEYDYEDKWVNDEIQGEFWDKLKKYEEKNDVYLKGN